MAARRYGTTTLPQILALRDQGLNWLDIATQLNVRPDGLRALVGVLGIQGAKNAEVGTYPVEQWVRRLASGDTAQDIARTHGIPPKRVYGVLRNRGLPTTCRAAIKARGTASARRSVATKSANHRAPAHP